MNSMMSNPCFTKNLSAKPTFPTFFLIVKTVLGIWTVFIVFVIECMCCRTHTDNRFTCLNIFVNISHLLVRQFAEACKYYHQISSLQLFQSRDVGLILRIHISCFRINQNRTVVSKPWCLANILASSGNASSDRYSSSPLTNTICFPWPGPSPPL